MSPFESKNNLIEKPMHDPFEKAFNDYVAGNDKANIIVHCNKGDDEIIPVSYFFRKYEEMPELEKIALGLCSGKILDIGAGSGSHSLYLQDKDFDVTALDIRSGFVDIMKKRGVKDVIHSDVFDYKGNKFDTLLMLMNGIGFTQNFYGLSAFLRFAKKLLKPSGQIILDSSDLMYLYKEDDGSYVINLNEDYYGEVEYIIEYMGTKGEPFSWLYVDFDNLSLYAEEAGFNCKKIFEDNHYNYLASLF
ncbi:MAG TPA: methyltransferase domain-containing protein [Bacteroidales bacterium]|nr:methyltransferase domain-containing protein [Bacteroidales bacterium]